MPPKQAAPVARNEPLKPMSGDSANGKLVPRTSDSVDRSSKGSKHPVIMFDDDEDRSRSTKLKNRNRRKGGFLSWLTSLLIKFGFFYVLIGALWTCSSTPFRFDYNLKDDRAHCRSLAQAKVNLQPILSPYYQSAHAKVSPYVKPYTDAATPYVQSAWKTTKPYYRYAHKQGRHIYNKQIDPVRKRAIKQGRTYVDPHLKVAQQHYKKSVQPHLDHAHRTIKPYRDIFHRDVAPYINQGYATSLAAGTQGWHLYNRHVHPAVIQRGKHAHGFYVNHFDPASRRAWALYVQPQVNKVLEKAFGRKAHAVGTEAIKEAKQEVKQARKEAEQSKRETVDEAQAAASRAVQEPTLADRLAKAKDQVTGGPLAAADPVASATSDAERAAESSATKEQLEAWEKGLAKLIDDEYRLTVTRFSEIRTGFSESLPERFEVLTEDVETEVEGIFARLAKNFDKLSRSSRPLSERVESGNEVIEKQKAKLLRSRAKSTKNLQELHDGLQEEESRAQEASVEEVRRYIEAAAKDYRKVASTLQFEDVKAEWSGWDKGLAYRSELFREELEEVRKGDRKIARGVTGIDAGQVGTIQREVAKLQKQLDSLYDTALAELGGYSSKHLASLGGSEASAAAGSVLESIVDSAKSLTGDAQEVLAAAAASLEGGSGNIGSAIAEKASQASASASSLASQASASASSLASQGSASASSFASQGSASASSIAGQGTMSSASKNVKSAGQGSVASSIKQYVQSAGDAIESGFEFAAGAEHPGGIPSSVSSIASSVSSVASNAASSLSSNARAAVKSSGVIDLEPESPLEYVTDVAKAVSQGLSSTVDVAGSSVSSVVRRAAQSIGAPVQPESPGEYAEAAAGFVVEGAASIASAASSIVVDGDVIHQATRSVASALGAQVTPEGVAKYVESIYDQASSVGDVIGSTGQSIYSSVASQASKMGGADVASSIGDAVHSATRSAGSVIGIKPTPETVQDYLEDAQEQAASLVGRVSSAIVPSGSAPSVVDSVQSAASEASKSVSSLYSSISKSAGASPVASSVSSAYSSVSSQAASYASSASSSVESLASQASKSVVSAVGGTPSAEGFVERVTDSVKSIRDEL